MKIYLHEITDQETELTFDEGEKWLQDAVCRVDEKSIQSTDQTGVSLTPVPARVKARPIQAEFTLRKVDDVVVANGQIDTRVELLCSRCATPFFLQVNPRFSSLFCKDPAMAGVGHLVAKGKPAGQTRGFARHAHDPNMDRDISEGTDLDITYLSEDVLDLSEIVTEQLQLQVPFQPLCREDCKGICTHCGADLNSGRCACSKIRPNSPFSVLQDLKVPKNQA